MRKIEILGKQWTVKELDALELSKTLQNESVYNLGACEYIGKTIYILNNLSKEQYKEVYTHELTHAILYESSLKQHLTDDQQEQYCEFMKFALPIISEILKESD